MTQGPALTLLRTPPRTFDDFSPMEPVGRMQAAHLIERGHTRLGYAPPADRGLKPMAGERLRGAAAECAAAGLRPPLALSLPLEAVVAPPGYEHSTTRPRSPCSPACASRT